MSYASDASLSPPTASRSVTASPPRHSIAFTAQQRELKRQRDQVRREAKAASRRVGSTGVPDLSLSGSAPGSSPVQKQSFFPPTAPTSAAGSPSSFLQPSSPPSVTMADLSASSSNGGLPGIYTTSAPSQISLLAEPVTTSSGLGSPSYMATGGAYSPAMQDHNQGVFSGQYQGQPSYMPAYTAAPYSSAPSSSLHQQYPYVQCLCPWALALCPCLILTRSLLYRRSAMHDQQGMMYQMPQPGSAMMSGSPGTMPLPHGQMSHTHLSHHGSQPHSSHHRQHVTPPSPHLSHGHGSHSSSHHHHSYEGIVGGPGGPGGGGGLGEPGGVRVVHSRPKPQCWEHGCNGRQFSTFSNLLRHQREKSGQAAKAVCPNCGAEFTRTTARNGHLQHDKCKQRRNA